MTEAKISDPSDRTGRRYVVISADSHDGPPYDYAKYADYIDPQHRDAFNQWLSTQGAEAALTTRFGGPSLMNQFERKEPVGSENAHRYRRYYDEMMVGRMTVDAQWVEESFGRHYEEEPQYLDPARRIPAVETQGIVGEVINTTGLTSGSKNQFGSDDPLLYRAGSKAHLRWLADFCGAAPGRLAAPVYIDGHDLDEAMEDIRWARDHGVFGGVFLPIQRTSNGMFSRSTELLSRPLPPYLDPHWEPLWALCQDLELPVVLHAGQNVAPDIATAYGSDNTAFYMMSAFEHTYFTLRPFFQMIAGGVLDRYPQLKFCATEIHVAALPGLFQQADHHTMGFAGFQRRGLKLAPSEYWYRNGFVAASLLSRNEVPKRHEVGIRNMMFGSDFPHPEGTFPNTQAAQRNLFAGVPENELRLILGENAARCFGFDLDQLQAIADRVGPSVEDLSAPLSSHEAPKYPSSFSFHTLAA